MSSRSDADAAVRKASSPDRRPVAVCGLPRDRFGPRTVRAAQLRDILSRDRDVVHWPGIERPGPPRQPSRLERRLTAAARYLAEAVIIDRFEPAMRRRAGRLREADPAAGLLIGAPFSPCVVAAEVLRSLDRPYVLDFGDPWVLTGTNPEKRLLSGTRQRRVERRLWEGAAGAVLTTSQQAADIAEIFPDLEILVRPNGYIPADPAPIARPRESDGTLRLVHYGTLYGTRLDLNPALERLAAAGIWDHIELTQYGSDWSGALERVPESVSVVTRTQQPWDQIVASAGEFDAAVVVGFGLDNRWQLPSKAIQYLTLPIPRLAIACDTNAALYDYTADKPGYLTVTADERELPARLEAHLARAWMPAELAPPPGEAWPVVARELADFFLERVGMTGVSG